MGSAGSPRTTLPGSAAASALATSIMRCERCMEKRSRLPMPPAAAGRSGCGSGASAAGTAPAASAASSAACRHGGSIFRRRSCMTSQGDPCGAAAGSCGCWKGQRHLCHGSLAVLLLCSSAQPPSTRSAGGVAGKPPTLSASNSVAELVAAWSWVSSLASATASAATVASGSGCTIGAGCSAAGCPTRNSAAAAGWPGAALHSCCRGSYGNSEPRSTHDDPSIAGSEWHTRAPSSMSMEHHRAHST